MAQSESVAEALPSARLERNMELIHAAKEGDQSACERLLAPSVDHDATAGGSLAWDGSADLWFAEDDSLAWDALHYAADGGHTGVVRLLLQRGALWNGGKWQRRQKR